MEQTEALAYKGIHSSLRDPSKVALRVVWSGLDDAKVPVVAWSNSLGRRWFCQMFLMMASLGQLCFCLQSSGLEAPVSLQMPALSNSSLVVSQLWPAQEDMPACWVYAFLPPTGLWLSQLLWRAH